MKKLFIKNRKWKDICVLLEWNPSNKLAFVMHSLWSNKDSSHIKLIRDVLVDNDYFVVSFDVSNTYGESEGNFEDATATSYYQDLEDVISWASFQDRYKDRFILAWHSVWWFCVFKYAKKYPEKIDGIIWGSTLISHKSYVESKRPKVIESWRQNGIRKWESGWVEKTLKWDFVKDLLKHYLMDEVENLTMPIFMYGGDLDQIINIGYQIEFFDNLPEWNKQFYIIEWSEHKVSKLEEQENKDIIDGWLKDL